jgi:hypothetical protein
VLQMLMLVADSPTLTYLLYWLVITLCTFLNI